MFNPRKLLIPAPIVVCLLLLVSCGGGGSGGGGGGIPGAHSTMVVTGKAVLPPGFPGSLTGMTVQTNFDAQPVATDGTFHATVVGPGAVLVSLLDAAGKPVLLGLADGGTGKAEISADTTARALLFYAVGAFTAPSNRWTDLRAIIAQSSTTSQFATVVASRVAANPAALSGGDAQLVTALQAASAAMLKNGRSITGMPSRALAATYGSASTAPTASSATITVTRAPGVRGRAALQILVDPGGQQSGVEVLNSVAEDGIVFVNHLRRRCAAFIYETAVQQVGGNLTDITPKPLTTTQPTTLSALGQLFHIVPPGAPSPVFEVEPSNELNGLVGSLTNLNETFGAFTPIRSDTVPLPQDGDAIKTVYKVFVFGPAFQQLNLLNGFPPFNDPRFASFAPQWLITLNVLAWEEYILDVAIPIICAVLPDGATFKGEKIHINAVEQLVDVIGKVPGINADVAKGDLSQAMVATIRAIIDDRELGKTVVGLIYSIFTPEVTLTGQLATAQADLEKTFEVLQTVEIVLQIIDSSAVLVSSITNNPAEQWTGIVVQNQVRLSPPTATVSADSPTVDLNATPDAPGDSTAPFMYHWSVAGAAGGGLVDSTHVSGKDKDFDSLDSKITYAVATSATSGQTDTVTVEVFANTGTPDKPVRGTRFGAATSLMTVHISSQPCSGFPASFVSRCGDVQVTPTTVKPGGNLHVKVTLNVGGNCGNGASVSLNGIPFTSAKLDGLLVSTQADGSVSVPGDPAGGFTTVTHFVDFIVSGSASDQCPTRVQPHDGNLDPIFGGPWVHLNGGTWNTFEPFEVRQ